VTRRGADDESRPPDDPGGSTVRNVLSFDTEHWYSATLLADEVDDPTGHIRESVGIVLDVLRRHDVTATFFVVGEVARDYPDLVARIADEGHEVGSHGHTHTPVFDLTRESFRREVDRSVDAIRAAIGRRPRGFRAPNFSVTPATDWAIDVLARRGFHYDSSVFPVRTPMYGVANAPRRPYVARSDAPFTPDGERDPVAAIGDPDVSNDGGPAAVAGVEAREDAVLELPLAVYHPRVPLPIAGGFYARLLPDLLLERGIRNLNARGVPATVYFHPWEFNPSVIRDDVPLHKRFVSFYGLERTTETLSALLRTFPFGPARAIVDGW
jgi:polysaccharide deacetylase family protein (PEP-CTERM system associated)